MAGFIAGIGLVILMLVLNMTIAVGTPSGILFYANNYYSRKHRWLLFSHHDS